MPQFGQWVWELLARREVVPSSVSCRTDDLPLAVIICRVGGAGFHLLEGRPVFGVAISVIVCTVTMVIKRWPFRAGLRDLSGVAHEGLLGGVGCSFFRLKGRAECSTSVWVLAPDI